ncbi:MAG: terminase TerL endonuclease subunit, partial [Patescibacteria group bacterium]
AADRVCDFFTRHIKHVEGELAGQPFVLGPWERDQIVRPFFGWKRANGTRRYRVCYVEVPKKNGKSTLAAGLALYLEFCDQEPGAKIFSVAADRLQAGIIFEIGAQMRDESPALHRRSVRFRRSLYVPKWHATWSVLSSDVSTKHGINAHAILFDELHAQRTRELYDALTGAVAARRQPVKFFFTTAGFDRTSICWKEHEYADQVLRGVKPDDAYLAVIYAADEKADWTSPATWAQANPNLGVSVKLDFLTEECRKAQADPAAQNNFKRLHLNIWTSAESRWLPWGLWDKCNFPVDEEALAGRECFGGLDLATVNDLAAYLRVFPPLSIDEPIKVLAKFWIPRDNIRARVLRDGVPYDAWVRDGWITATEGNVIDFAVILRDVFACRDKTPIRELAFDRWGAQKIMTDLAEGLGSDVLVQFGQGYASMSPPMKELHRLLLSRKIAHGGNPVLRWMADNVMAVTDPAGNIKPDKGKSREKIDGIVALIMAIARLSLAPEGAYEQEG